MQHGAAGARVPGQYLWGYARYKQPRTRRPRMSMIGRPGHLLHAPAGALAAALGARLRAVVGLAAVSWSCRAGASWTRTWRCAFRSGRPSSAAHWPRSSCAWRRPGWTAAGCGTAARSACERLHQLPAPCDEFDGRAADHDVRAAFRAGWTRAGPRCRSRCRARFIGIYTPRANRCWTPGSGSGRSASARCACSSRADGVKTIVSGVARAACCTCCPT